MERVGVDFSASASAAWLVAFGKPTEKVSDAEEPGPSRDRVPRYRARYWDRTSDLFGVNEARYRCANRACNVENSRAPPPG